MPRISQRAHAVHALYMDGKFKKTLDTDICYSVVPANLDEPLLVCTITADKSSFLEFVL